MKMWTPRYVHISIFCFIFLCSGILSPVASKDVPQIVDISPSEGGMTGGTMITINGANFAETLFTLDPTADVGNKVWLSGLVEPYECDIHPDGTRPDKITCYTKPMPKGEYTITVSVDGVDVPDANYCPRQSDCIFTVRDDRTPTITKISPYSGLPGQIIEMEGDLKTNKYDSTIPDETQPNIVRVYFGGQKCELRKSLDEMYGLEYSPETKLGTMKCKAEGTYIGNVGLSFLVNKGYGRSKIDRKVVYPRSTGPGSFQTYSIITRVSPDKGSIAGGTLITITGEYFDETDSPVKVTIAGGRGFYAYVHSGRIDAETMNKSAADVQHVDGSEWRGYNLSGHTVLIAGYFRPFYSGNYSFCVRAASTAKVFLSMTDDPVNKTLQSEGTSTCGKTLSFVPLKKGERYYMETHYQSDEEDSYVMVNTFLKETDYTEEETGWAQHEVQRFKIISRTDPEIQIFDVTASGNTEQTSNVQKLDINGDPTATFAIGIDGIFTTPFTLDGIEEQDVIDALKELPNIDFNVIVTIQEKGDQKSLIITSDSPLGPINNYEGVQLTGLDGALTFSNTRRIEGSAASNYFALKMNGATTSALEEGSSANDIKSALEDLFNVQCHPKLNEGSLTKFESKTEWFMWEIVANTEPFCGHASLRNPSHGLLFYVANDEKKMRLTASNKRHICFAYKGLGGVKSVGVKFEHVDDEDGEKSTKYRYFDIDQTDTPKAWNYFCDDLYNRLRTTYGGLHQSVVWVKIIKRDGLQDIFVDHFSFRKDIPFGSDYLGKISVWRKRQVQPNGFFIDKVDVSKSGSRYEVELKPLDCGHDLPVFEVVNGNASKAQEASIPIEGTYKILFKGDETEPIKVNVEADPSGVADLLGATKMGFSQVTGSGTCSGFNYEIKMLSQTGDQPQLSLDTSQLTGATVTSRVYDIIQGGLWFSPIMGDLLRTHHTTPQVIAYVNNIPTHCADPSACSFVWDASETPTVSGISPESGSRGDVLKIRGSGLTGLQDDGVLIGKTTCNIVSRNDISIKCTIGSGPTGPAPVRVYVEGKGHAAGIINFTFVTNVTSMSTMSGSLQGGSVLAFNGYGFTSDAEIDVDGQACRVINVTESYMECITPRAASLNTTDVNVTVSQVGSSKVVGTFTYSLADTPIITSLNVSTSFIDGGDVIAISGIGFGTEEMPVTLKGVNLTVISYNDTEIIAILPSLPHGSYKLVVNVDGKGYADLRTNSILEISYSFIVNGMYPNVGSLYGGTDILLEGVGFKKHQLKIRIGRHSCDIESVNHTNVKCRIAETSTHHHIFANGTHRNYGPGYAWNKSPHTVNVGDKVTWHWETPFYVKDIKYSVRQTVKANDLIDMEGGFSSGPKTRKGTFTHVFTVPGTYNYWTGYMDSGNSIYFRGNLVVEALNSSSNVLSVHLNGKEAYYNKSASSTTPSFSCPEMNATLDGCADIEQVDQRADRFNFKFSKCVSPYIDDLSHTSGSFDDVISLTGGGFGPRICQNEVFYGNDGCTTVVKISPTLDFKISKACQHPIGELHPFKVYVHNVGYALMSLPSSSTKFGLLPLVEDISPKSGSKVGGTAVTITGAGFVGERDDIIVEFTKLSCDIKSVTYNKIICDTHCSSSHSNCPTGEMTFTVTVGNIPAKCDASVCKYNPMQDNTPEVDSVTPTSTSAASTVLTFTGQKLASTISDLKVMVGDVECAVYGVVNDTYFTCIVTRLPAGINDVSVYVSNLGNAATSAHVNSERIASITSPSESSIHGGASLIITGNGFVKDKTTITVNNADCPIKKISLSKVSCTIPENSADLYDVIVRSNGMTYPTLSLNYTMQSTPEVLSISPESGQSNDPIQITGQGFLSPDGSAPKVEIGGVKANCMDKPHTNTSIFCMTGIQSTGQFPVKVFVAETGFSNDNVNFTYELGTFTVNPSTGSTNGGQLVTLTGSGFLQNETEVKICGNVCEQISSNSSVLVCKTSAHDAETCDVVADVRGIVHNESSAYIYNSSLLSTITGINPTRGGTGGGTPITVTGTNFGTNEDDLQVKIAGSTCDVQTVSDTEIVCRTGPASSVISEIKVQRSGWGLSEQINATFEYIDVWSSRYTWGGDSIPKEGDFIIIQKGQKILLDTNTPILEMLLIQGGHLVFDEKDIEVQAKSILIVGGGIFEVGTEDKPFENEAIITLHGHVRSKELPIYGAKGIGLRNGRLDLHGRHVPVTWTRLSKTADAGSYVLNLTHSVNWRVGDDIVIATTGDRLSQKESEVRKIAAISEDGTSLRLETPLEYEHISKKATFGSRNVEFSAEVGILKRNVVVRGNRNKEFDEDIEACPDGFNPGEFATQTCFQGRFGEEVGSDQYGVQILIHQQEKDTQVAVARIEDIEVTFAGQAFRLGRYPIHFHLNGNMSKSYVRRCSIHDTFNRAVNIHGSHNTMVENNVIYNVMGGALFLEDGIEVGNTFQFNLEIFIKSSTSLLNDDITPAAIWITNPYNFVRHNVAAGGTHFGTWYRMHKHPDGPESTTTICPQNIPLGEFSNNTAHSLGWFALWIFETYIPTESMTCSSSAPHKVAKFHGLFAWNNNKGAETVNTGAVQFHDFIVINNQHAGIQFSLISGNPPQYDAVNGPGVFNSLIVGRHAGLDGVPSKEGIALPHFNGFSMHNTEFHNFDHSRSVAFSWAAITGTCGDLCGGFTTFLNNITFVNSPKKVKFQWENEGILHDMDGSLTGEAGGSAAACSGSFDPSKCTENKNMSVGVKGCQCTSDVKLFRFAFNNILPSSLLFKKVFFNSTFGATVSDYRFKRISHKSGWQVVVAANESYYVTFENADHVINISYDATLYDFRPHDYVIITQDAYQMPDSFTVDGKTKLPMSNTFPKVANGAWHYTNSNIIYTLSNQEGNEMPVKMRTVRCYWRGCSPPPSPMAVIKQPENAEYTSIISTWKNITKHGGVPQPNDDIHVTSDRWIVVDTVLPKFGKVIIDGGLQFAENFTLSNLLEADYIYIRGRLVAGWSDENPFNGKLTIRLRGQHSTPNIEVTDGPNLGSKFIAVFGGLQLHGVNRGITKTYLASEAVIGDSQITVKDSVNWRIGEEIVITTTDYNAWHTEVFKITAVSGENLRLNGTMKYNHIAYTETVNGEIKELSASVALLNRNIRVEGAEYPNIEEESFGARIIVGQTSFNNEFFSGFAQVSNVEFYHCGQEGYTENYDARYALTYMSVTNTKGKVRYSYVRNNAFHNGYSPAIGVFGTADMEIDSNIVHHSVGQGIQTESARTRITNNLVILSIWPGAYLDREESQNFDFPGAIDGIKATDLVLENNTVSGAERTGYRVPGQFCDTPPEKLWSGNMAHSCQSGLNFFESDTPVDKQCVALSGFTFYKNFDYGIYYINFPSLVVKDNIFIENGIGVTPYVVGPAAVKHIYDDKKVTIENNVFIGKTPHFSETLDVIPNDKNVEFSGQARGLSSDLPCGKIGILSGTFTSGGNLAPRKPWMNIMSYQAIKGVTLIQGNMFKDFGSCEGGKKRDHAIATNKGNDDVIHPMVLTDNQLDNVTPKAKLLFHIPNIGKVNPSDCVDMDCDAHKKSLLTDTDGSFLGFVGNVLPEAAYQWDQNPNHGLGDYRIPKQMLATSDGEKLDVKDIAPHKGLYKIDECTWIPEWVAYQCNNSLEWRMIVAESLDDDTELRRLSPIAVFNTEGYVDLVNGPQDHGWCSGYTCQKRLSTFPILVALDTPFKLYLTSTNPRKMRFILLNSKPTDCVQLSLWYTTINRLELTVDGKIILPNNAFYDSKQRYRLKTEDFEGQWMPHIENKTNGENYVSQVHQTITWTQCGEADIVLTRKAALLVSFTLPEMTVDEFFGENLVENLAAFLKIDPKRVRVVNVVSNTSPAKRRRRETTTNTVFIEISDLPGEPPSIDYTEVGDEIINMVQLGSVSEVLKVEVLYTTILDAQSDENEPVILQRPGQLILETPPTGLVSEDMLLTVQPKLKVIDTEGKIVDHLGSDTLVWEVEVTIKSGGTYRSQLLGTTRLNFTKGWANYTDLAINELGTEYILEFKIVSPASATNFSIESPFVIIYGKSFLPKAISLSQKKITNTSVVLEVGLVDKSTNLDFTEISWKNYTWKAEAEIYNELVYGGELTGTTEITFNPQTGKGTFSNLLFDEPGICPLLVIIKSIPDFYTLKMVVNIDLMSPDQDSIIVDVSHDIDMKFPITYDEEKASFWASQVANVYNTIPGMRIVKTAHRPGSTYITLSVEASNAGINATLTTMCNDADQGRTFTFDSTTVKMSAHLEVDGKSYYGVKCGPIAEDDGPVLDSIYIIIIVVMALVIMILVIVVIYKCCVQPKPDKHLIPVTRVTPVPPHYAKSGDLLKDILLREESSSSLQGWKGGHSAPISTKPPTPFDLGAGSPNRTPSPAWTK